MKRTTLTTGIVLSFVLSLLACGGGGSPMQDTVIIERAFPDLTFSAPISMQQLPGDNTRWFMIEKGGKVLMFDNDDAVASVNVSADFSSIVDAEREGGLLGMAFHPSFSGSGQVYFNYTVTGPGPATPVVTKVVRYNMNTSGVIDTGTMSLIISVDQPDTNHNGGDIKFGPDGYLYIALGDGGGVDDEFGNGQDTTTLLGSMLRLDVDAGSPYAIPAGNVFAVSSTGMPEIYAWGLRNPWRFSFDVLTDDLWLGDVGQGSWEEINLIISGGNYGWNIEEGGHCFSPPTGCDDTGLIDPVFEYGRTEGRSVTGGYVYRGAAIPEYYGYYLFSDWGSGNVWGFDAATIQPGSTLLIDTDRRFVSFAQDQDLELYLVDISGGGVYRLIPAP